MGDFTPEEQLCYNELIQAGLDPETAQLIAPRQAALRKARESESQAAANAPARRRTQKKAETLELDYRTTPHMPAWVQRAIEASLAIESESAREAGALGYLARAMVIATLPYKHQKNPDGSARAEYTRKNGSFTLRIVAGYEGGIPYGIYPRLLLSWVASEAVRTRSPHIELGSSLSGFLREVLGVQPARGGGPRSSGALVVEQIKRLFGSIITAAYKGKEGESSFVLRNVLIASQLELSERELTAVLKMNNSYLQNLQNEILTHLGETPKVEGGRETQLWTPATAPSPGERWQSSVVLSPGFYEECVTNPVPVDLRAYRALKGSPLAMDVYAWLTYRMSYLRKQTPPIPWEALYMQFGSGLSVNAKDPTMAIRDFKKAFIKALNFVLVVYPEARVEDTAKGLILKPSPTHIPKLANKPVQKQLF